MAPHRPPPATLPLLIQVHAGPARLRCAEAARQLAYHPHTVESYVATWPAHAVGLIHDGLPLAGCSTRLVLWRANCPTLPIVLYVPPAPGAAELLMRAALVPGVHGLLQFDRPDELPRLVALLGQCIGEAPLAQARAMLARVLRQLPAEATPFVHAALHHLQRGDGTRSVATLAAETGVPARTLQRRLTAPRPTPTELLGWALLAAVATTAARDGTDIYHAAAMLGIRRERLQRCATTLVGGKWPEQGQVFLAYVRVALRTVGERAAMAPLDRRASG